MLTMPCHGGCGGRSVKVPRGAEHPATPAPRRWRLALWHYWRPRLPFVLLVWNGSELGTVEPVGTPYHHYVIVLCSLFVLFTYRCSGCIIIGDIPPAAWALPPTRTYTAPAGQPRPPQYCTYHPMPAALAPQRRCRWRAAFVLADIAVYLPCIPTPGCLYGAAPHSTRPTTFAAPAPRAGALHHALAPATQPRYCAALFAPPSPTLYDGCLYAAYGQRTRLQRHTSFACTAFLPAQPFRYALAADSPRVYARHRCAFAWTVNVRARPFYCFTICAVCLPVYAAVLRYTYKYHAYTHAIAWSVASWWTRLRHTCLFVGR